MSSPGCEPCKIPCSLLSCCGRFLLREAKLIELKISSPMESRILYIAFILFPIFSSCAFPSPCAHPPNVTVFRPPSPYSLTSIYVSFYLHFPKFLFPSFFFTSFYSTVFSHSRLSSVHFHSFFHLLRYSFPFVLSFSLSPSFLD